VIQRRDPSSSVFSRSHNTRHGKRICSYLNLTSETRENVPHRERGWDIRAVSIVQFQPNKQTTTNELRKRKRGQRFAWEKGILRNFKHRRFFSLRLRGTNDCYQYYNFTHTRARAHARASCDRYRCINFANATYFANETKYNAATARPTLPLTNVDPHQHPSLPPPIPFLTKYRGNGMHSCSPPHACARREREGRREQMME